MEVLGSLSGAERMLGSARRWIAEQSSLRKIAGPPFYAWQAIRYGQVTRRNRNLEGRFAGRRCFVMLTAPSVNLIDFSRLSGQLIFGCNFVFKHALFQDLPVAVYLAADPWPALRTRRTVFEAADSINAFCYREDNYERLIQDKYSDIDSYIADHPAAIANAPADFYQRVSDKCPDPRTVFLTSVANKAKLAQHGIFAGREINYVRSSGRLEAGARPSHDLAGRFTFLRGVAVLAIGVAIYMGIREIVLCGAGYTYQPMLNCHFYGEPLVAKDLVRKRPEVTDEIAASFGNSRIWKTREEGDYVRLTLVKDAAVNPVHRLVREYAAANGVEILNLVPDGFRSPVYRAVSIDDVNAMVSSS